MGLFRCLSSLPLVWNVLSTSVWCCKTAFSMTLAKRLRGALNMRPYAVWLKEAEQGEAGNRVFINTTPDILHWGSRPSDDSQEFEWDLGQSLNLGRRDASVVESACCSSKRTCVAFLPPVVDKLQLQGTWRPLLASGGITVICTYPHTCTTKSWMNKHGIQCWKKYMGEDHPSRVAGSRHNTYVHLLGS